MKTTPRVERKDLLGIQTAGLPPPPTPPRSGSSSLAEMSGMFYRRVEAMGEGERVWSPDYLQSPDGTGRHETIRQRETSSHKSGGLVLRC
jgi:hypothetical protein